MAPCPAVLGKGGDQWKTVKQYKIDCLRFSLEHKKAWRELEDITPFRYEDLYLKAALLNSEGRLWEAKEYVESFLPRLAVLMGPRSKINADCVIWFHVNTLASLGLTDLARAVLCEHRNLVLSEGTILVLESVLALAEGDLPRARRFLSELEGSTGSSYFVSTRQLFAAAWIELSSGNTKAAEIFPLPKEMT